MSKVIFIDWSVFLHTAVYSCMKRQEMQFALNLSMKMVFACLKKIEINREDLLIFSMDSPLGSWRREVDNEYKRNRAKTREKTGLDWNVIFADFAVLIENLDMSTPFHIVQVDRLESDDIISVGCRYFTDKEIIIISTDSDFEQLVKYENVKIFSPKTKRYKVIKQSPHSIIAKKIKREQSDNLITPIRSVEEFEKRDLIVNLLRLPEYVENKAVKALTGLSKEYDTTLFRFPNMIYEIEDIYNNEKKTIVTWTDSFRAKKKKQKKETLF